MRGKNCPELLGVQNYLDCPFPVIIIMKNSKDMLKIKQILLAKAVKNCLFQCNDILKIKRIQTLELTFVNKLKGSINFV